MRTSHLLHGLSVLRHLRPDSNLRSQPLCRPHKSLDTMTKMILFTSFGTPRGPSYGCPTLVAACMNSASLNRMSTDRRHLPSLRGDSCTHNSRTKRSALQPATVVSRSQVENRFVLRDNSSGRGFALPALRLQYTHLPLCGVTRNIPFATHTPSNWHTDREKAPLLPWNVPVSLVPWPSVRGNALCRKIWPEALTPCVSVSAAHTLLVVHLELVFVRAWPHPMQPQLAATGSQSP